MEYLFLLGRHPDLSTVEIAAYLRRKHVSFSMKKRTEQFVVIDAPSLPNAAAHELGGTLLIAREVDLKTQVLKKDKIAYALIMISGDEGAARNALKEFCAEQRVKGLQKYGGVNMLSPSKLNKIDYVFMLYNDRFFMAEQISNPKEYKERDETRPVFDPLAVTSIRLAKILINLSEAEHEILDPFCGTGTILQEALLSGYRVIGIDKQIADAKKNVASLGKERSKRATLIQGDARRLSSLMKKVEAVVTEPYMGPYMKKIPMNDEAQQIIASLTDLYREVFREAARIVEGKIVIVIPRIRTYTSKFDIPMNALLKEAGLKVSSPVPSIALPIFYPKKRSKIDRFVYIVEKA